MRKDLLIENAQDSTLLLLISEGIFLAGDKRYVVRVPGYYLALHCVTNAQYARFLNALQPNSTNREKWIDLGNACHVQQYGDTYVAREGKQENPVVQVSWFGAQAYCEWAGLRLPSELEWEKGARGLDGRDFPWGNHWDVTMCLNAADTPETATSNVWEFALGTSPWGIYQMSGNVWEWCHKFYIDNLREGCNGDTSLRPYSSDTKPLCGGAGNFVNTGVFRCTSRFNFTPCRRYDICGFRCARDK